MGDLERGQPLLERNETGPGNTGMRDRHIVVTTMLPAWPTTRNNNNNNNNNDS